MVVQAAVAPNRSQRLLLKIPYGSLRRRSVERMTEGRRCQVHLLDDRKLELLVQPKLLAKELLDLVASHFNLKEKEYFGIAFTDETGHFNWLQLDRRVLEHDFPKKSGPVVLYFCVRFYIESISYLKDNATIELFFLNAKSCIYKELIDVDSEVVFELASYILQEAKGDFSSNEVVRSDLKKLPALPTQALKEHPSLAYCEDRVIEHYKKLNGQTRGQAIVNYMSIVESLPTYGVHYYAVKDKQGIPWWLGLSYKGIFQYDYHDKVKPRKIFQWRQLENLYFREKKFSVEVHDPRRASVTRRTFGHSGIAVHTWYACPALIKSIWAMAISQHQFYLDRKQSKSKIHAARSLSEIAIDLTETGTLKTSKLAHMGSKGKIISGSSGSLLSSGSQESDSSQSAKKDMLAALKSRQEALEETLRQRLEELKRLCLREASPHKGLPPRPPSSHNRPPPPQSLEGLRQMHYHRSDYDKSPIKPKMWSESSLDEPYEKVKKRSSHSHSGSHKRFPSTGSCAEAGGGGGGGGGSGSLQNSPIRGLPHWNSQSSMPSTPDLRVRSPHYVHSTRSVDISPTRLHSLALHFRHRSSSLESQGKLLGSENDTGSPDFYTPRTRSSNGSDPMDDCSSCTSHSSSEHYYPAQMNANYSTLAEDSPNPGEEPPIVRRRIGTAFKLDEQKILPKGEEAELERLEREFAIQSQITEAARRLASDPNVSKKLKKQRKTSYLNALKKLQEIENAINENRVKSGKKPTQRTSLVIDDGNIASEDSSLSDALVLEDEDAQVTSTISPLQSPHKGLPPRPPSSHNRPPPPQSLEGLRQMHYHRSDYDKSPIKPKMWSESSLDEPYEKVKKRSSHSHSGLRTPSLGREGAHDKGAGRAAVSDELRQWYQRSTSSHREHCRLSHTSSTSSDSGSQYSTSSQSTFVAHSRVTRMPQMCKATSAALPQSQRSSTPSSEVGATPPSSPHHLLTWQTGSYTDSCFLDSSLYPELADVQWYGQEKAKPGTLV
ncbi:PREDICTED: FERM domain-containing protein 4A [Dipodomys ordii]|uniref:FERM domain-containing protein 4A n=1 Tax=Dipodomys ordii TaxID=10020 RepID=A0A1S3F1H8_DIPOR|nr:PREDICTED: FERM domain-containing protein 4A [Dipodomys ordii]